MVQITPYTEELILSAYVQKRREIEPVVQAIAAQGASKLPFSATICFQIDKACKQISSTPRPSGTVLKDQERRGIGTTLALLTMLEVCATTQGSYEDSPLGVDRKSSNRTTNVLAAAWKDVWAWEKWFHDHWLSKIPADPPELSKCQQVGVYSLLNMMALYCSHGTQLLDLVLATPKTMGILALHHVRGHLPMEFAQRIQHVTHIVGYEESKKIVSEMVEVAHVDGKGGEQVLAKATVRQITLLLDSPMANWGPKETLHLTTQFSFLEAITLGHNGVRDALINVKIVPLVVRVVDLYAKGLAPMDGQSRHIIRKGVSYLMSLHTVQKNSSWIAQAVKAGMISAILKSVYVTQDTVDSDYAKWMIAKFLPQSIILYSLLKPIEKACQTAEVKRLTRNERTMGVLWEPWQQFLKYKQSRVALMQAFDDTDKYASYRWMVCSNRECDKEPLYTDLKVCQQCKLLWYCSPECQRADWPRHKAACKHHQESRHQEKFPKLSSEDTAFLHFVGRFDTRNSNEYITSLVKEHHRAGNAENETYIRVDYTRIPYQFSVHKTVYEGSNGFQVNVEMPQLSEIMRAQSARTPVADRPRYPLLMLVTNGKCQSAVFAHYELGEGASENGLALMTLVEGMMQRLAVEDNENKDGASSRLQIEN